MVKPVHPILDPPLQRLEGARIETHDVHAARKLYESLALAATVDTLFVCSWLLPLKGKRLRKTLSGSVSQIMDALKRVEAGLADLRGFGAQSADQATGFSQLLDV